jgi:hypothetical protein
MPRSLELEHRGCLLYYTAARTVTRLDRTHRSRLWCVRDRVHTGFCFIKSGKGIRTSQRIYGRLTRTPRDAAVSTVALYSASEAGAQFSYTHRNVHFETCSTSSQLQHSTLVSTRYRLHIVYLACANDTGFTGSSEESNALRL